MANNKAGAAKTRATLSEKLGEHGYRQHMARIGSRGGKKKVPKGFHYTRRKAPDAQELHKPRTQEGRDENADNRT